MVDVSSYALLVGKWLIADQPLSYFADEEVSKKSINNNTALIHAHDQPDEQSDILTSFLEILLSKMPLLEETGLKKIIVHVNLAYEGQCNWELDLTQLTLLVKIKAVFTLTAYETNGD